MLKRTIAKLEDAPEAVRDFYKQDGDVFVLQVDGRAVEDTTALKNAKDHEKNLRVAAEGKVAELAQQVTTVSGERDTIAAERDAALADKGADVSAIETSWKGKLDAALADKDNVSRELTTEIERLLVTTTANNLAHEISVVPELFSSVIAGRLKVEKGADGKYFTRVLDATGAPTANNLDDLRKELLANEKYSPIIIAGKGSGGGAGDPGSGGGATEKKWLEHTDEELVELSRTDPDKYERLKKAHQNVSA